MPGEYQVTIQGFRKTGRKVRDPQMGPIAGNRAHPVQRIGTLKATIIDGRDEVEFALTRRKGR